MSGQATAVFFDIDGVLHPQPSSFYEDAYRYRESAWFRWQVALLDALAPYPDCHLVLHSSWRLAYRGPDLHDSLPPELGARLTAVANPGIASRFGAIQDYARRHQLTGYVIVDDEAKEFPPGLPELLLLDPDQGLGNPAAVAQLAERLRLLHAI